MKKRFYVIIDTESMVAEGEHRLYQAAERFRPRSGQRDSGRRGQRGANDPLTSPRWMFQQIIVTTALICATHDNGNIVPVSLNTFSAADLDERAILERLFAVVDDLPPDSTDLVTYGGCWADVPLIVIRAMKHGLALPRPWKWMAWGGQGAVPHIDLMRMLTGSSKMKASHMSEFAAVLDIPAKMSAAPWSAAELTRRREWDRVAEMGEADCITTALLFASWRRLHEGGAAVETVHDRIYREIEALCPGRRYSPIIKERRRRLFEHQASEAKAHMEKLLSV